MIELPSGKQVSVLRINNKIAKKFSRDITRFQLEERGGAFIFRFVPTAQYTMEKTGKALLVYFSKLFGNELKCILETVPHIPVNEEGKTPLLISSARIPRSKLRG